MRMEIWDRKEASFPSVRAPSHGPRSPPPLALASPSRTKQLSAFAGIALRGLADASKVAVTTVSEGSRDLSRKVAASGVTEKLSGAMTGSVAAVKGAVADPEQALGNLWSSARGLWGSASSFVQTQLANGGGSPDSQRDVPARFRTDSDEGVQEGLPPAPSASMSGRPPPHGGASAAAEAAATASRAAAVAAAAQDRDKDNEDWLASQVAQVHIGSEVGGGRRKAEWSDWLDADEDAPKGKVAASTKQPVAEAPAQSTKSRSGSASAAPPSLASKKDDDFFAQW